MRNVRSYKIIGNIVGNIVCEIVGNIVCEIVGNIVGEIVGELARLNMSESVASKKHFFAARAIR